MDVPEWKKRALDQFLTVVEENSALRARVAELERLNDGLENDLTLALTRRDIIETDIFQKFHNRVAELERVLKLARCAIDCLDDDALGRDPHDGHPYRAELLDKIETALGKEARWTGGAMSEWISVEDRLPEHRRVVLAWIPTMRPCEAWYVADPIGNTPGYWATHFVGSTYSVTHWMPLPPPPGDAGS